MGGLASDIVERAILHAQRLSANASYQWPTARAALSRILEDLEQRARDDESLERLRRFIAEGDRASAERSGEC
ncbi:hypothetical protein DFR50_11166 [Roseiarcus fermentans]|uniref:Uncharacterized protein n=2 Tax=Roseiarcus fermentans TaxID=1473586 RepID=A0A366FGK8_9HYPH|nr:hypothetical protein DFR50_11166 [Roseiarcus fermentans]